jgi:hypothetical protein
MFNDVPEKQAANSLNAWRLLTAGYVFDLLFSPEDRGIILHRKVNGILSDYTAL